MVRRLIEWNNDHTSYSFILFIQKMTKRTKVSSFERALLMKNEFGLKKMLIMIIFLVSNQGLARVLSRILIGYFSSAKKRQRRGRKEKRSTTAFSRSFSLSLSTKKKQINRFILQIPSSFSFLFFFFSLAREVS